MTPRRDFLSTPAAWTRTARSSTTPGDFAGIERDPRRSGNHWLDWVMLALAAGVMAAYLMERMT